MTQRLVPTLMCYFLSIAKYTFFFLRLAYILLKISSPYGDDVPKTQTTSISTVKIFHVTYLRIWKWRAVRTARDPTFEYSH